MGVVGSLPSSPSLLPLTNNTDIQNEHSILSSNENTNDTTSVTPNVTNGNYTKTCDHQESYKTMTHDQSCAKKYQLVASRLKTRRCSKHRRCLSKQVMKRKLRNKKKRETIQKLESKRYIMREQLKQRVQELELKQNDLLSTIQKLHLYKKQLEVVYQQISSNLDLIE